MRTGSVIGRSSDDFGGWLLAHAKLAARIGIQPVVSDREAKLPRLDLIGRTGPGPFGVIPKLGRKRRALPARNSFKSEIPRNVSGTGRYQVRSCVLVKRASRTIVEKAFYGRRYAARSEPLGAASLPDRPKSDGIRIRMVSTGTRVRARGGWVRGGGRNVGSRRDTGRGR